MAFTKFHLFVCQRAVILQREIIQGKPKIRVSYFAMRNPYMKFQDDISMPHTYMYIHTVSTKRNAIFLMTFWGVKKMIAIKTLF